MAGYTPETFAAAVLRRLGKPVTRANVRALVGWEKAEGGHWNNQARYNPLNTTQPEPGAGNTGSQGNIKVYRSPQQGINATVRTLKNGRYGGILSALGQGNDPRAVAAAIGNSPWGTSADLVNRVIGATPAPKNVKGLMGAYASTKATPVGTTYGRSVTTPGVDNSQARGRLLMSYLQGGAGNIGNVFTQLAETRDVAPSTKVVYGKRAAVGGSSPATGGNFAKSHSPLKELFWQGAGGIDAKNGAKVPQGFVSGHQDHVHVAAGPKTVVELGHIAQSRFGLHVGENPKFGGVHPVHVSNSFHYKGEAIDVSGTPAKMRAFAHYVASLYGIK